MDASSAHILSPIDSHWIADRVRRLLGVADDDLRRRRAFFCSLEMSTNELLTPFLTTLSAEQRALRTVYVRSTIAHLLSRLRRRLAAPRPESGAREVAPREVRIEALAELSRIQVENLRTHFTKAAGSLDSLAIELAFVAFANGELRLGPNGSSPGRGPADPHMTLDAEPSGDFFFLFAEFAFCAIEADLDPSVWRPLLPALVATQEIMIRAYAPPRGQRRMGQYSSVHFDRNFEVRMTAREIEQLFERYRGLDYAALDTQASRNAVAAYCDML